MGKSLIPLTPEELRHFKLPCPKCESYRTGLDRSTDGRDNIKFRCGKCGHVWRVRQSELDREIGLPASWSKPKQKSGRRKASPGEAGEETDMAKAKAKKRKGAKGAKKGSSKKSKRADGKTIASVITAELKKNAAVETDAVLAAVKKAFPSAKTTPSCVSWYRWKLGIKKPAAKKPAKAKAKAKRKKPLARKKS